jgi:hypothetical protein
MLGSRWSLQAALGVLGAVSLCVAGGCEVIVPSDLPAFTCTGDDPSACPPGQYCAGSACVACDSVHCSDGGGTVRDGSVDATLFDSSDSTVPLGDANGESEAIDAPDGSSMPDVAFDAPQVDAACGGALGCTCSADADCQSKICGNGALLTTGFNSVYGSVCTEPCCTAGDCPGGFVCFGPGTGGNYCVLSTDLGRSPALGAASPGSTCTQDRDCRSGKCDPSSRLCVDTCCSDDNCATPTACSLDPALDGHSAFACVVPPGGGAAHSACTVSAQCTSNVCEPQECRPRCCGTNTCTGSGFYACEQKEVGSDLVNVCRFPSSPPTGVAFGQPCAVYSDCITRACNPAALTCTEYCCVDADCGQYAPGYVCRPAQGAAPYLICVKP